jgi:5-methylcytosine-specific restriction endonuclease McrA
MTFAKPYLTMNKRKPIPEVVRQYVFERDDFQCQNCGRSTLHDPTVKLNVDHIIAITKGGSDDLSNLQTLCSRCNQQKSNHYSERFRRHFL